MGWRDNISAGGFDENYDLGLWDVGDFGLDEILAPFIKRKDFDQYLSQPYSVSMRNFQSGERSWLDKKPLLLWTMC